MKDEKMIIKVVDENGKEIECEVLFTFESSETNKSYVVYTDDSKDEEGNTKVYASSYVASEDGEIKQTFPIETEEEWKIIEIVLNEVEAEVKSSMEDSE